MIVIIDNYDSFTYNLVHYFEKLDPVIHVFQNNQLTAEEVRKLNPDLIVFSPGPGKPEFTNAGREILDKLSSWIPILGVCLGHQLIIEYFGGKVSKTNLPMHGKISSIMHNQKEIFEGIPNPTEVTRYHSLAAEEATLPACLKVTSRSEDGTIMGVSHLSLPVTGIQFHPESVTTPEGFQMLKNYYQFAKQWKNGRTGGNKSEKPLSAV